MKSVMTHLRLLQWAGPELKRLLVPTGLGCLQSLLLVAQAIVLATVLKSLFGENTSTGLPWLGALIGLLAVRAVLAIIRERLTVSAVSRINVVLRTRILRGLLARGPIAFASQRSGRFQALLVDGIENFDAYICQYIPQIVVTITNSIAVVTILLFIDVPVALVVAACVLLPLVLPRLWDRIFHKRGGEHWEAYSNLHSDFVDSLQAMTTIKALGATDRRQVELKTSSEQLLARTMRQMQISLFESGLNAFVLVAGPFIAVLLTIDRIRAGALAPTDIFVISLLAVELYRPYRDLASSWHAGFAGVTAGMLIMDELQSATIPTPASPKRLNRGEHPAIGIDVSSVGFRYPGAASDALTDVSLRIEPGEEIAIVGPSGSGKSTLLAMLQRFILPDAGSVRIDGIDLTATSQQECARVMNFVPQSPTLFHGTLLDNLREAAPHAELDELIDVISATGLQQLDPEGRPDEALVRDVGEKGALLSGGQRQRVAIARALLHETPVIVLDESTSALDIRSERAMLSEIASRRPTQTRIIVSHRLGAIQNIRRIVVMHDGRVAATGSHAELMDGCAVYARMFAEQQGGTGTEPDARLVERGAEDTRAERNPS